MENFIGTKYIFNYICTVLSQSISHT